MLPWKVTHHHSMLKMLRNCTVKQLRFWVYRLRVRKRDVPCTIAHCSDRVNCSPNSGMQHCRQPVPLCAYSPPPLPDTDMCSISDGHAFLNNMLSFAQFESRQKWCYTSLSFIASMIYPHYCRDLAHSVFTAV